MAFARDIIYRLGESGGVGLFGVGQTRRGFEQEPHRLLFLAVLGALRRQLRWRLLGRSLLVASGGTLAYIYEVR